MMKTFKLKTYLLPYYILKAKIPSFFLDVIGKMIELPEFKKALGKLAIDLSDEEILRIRDIQNRVADVFFDTWLKKRDRIYSASIFNISYGQLR